MAFNMFSKFSGRVRRVVNARRFRVAFLRRSSFQMPSSVKIGHRMVPLQFPVETGVWCDFLTCFVDDEYGLADLPCVPKTIVDVGSNIGFFSMAARAYFPQALIHAYEPSPRALGFCKQNLLDLGVVVYGEALGSSAGEVFLDDAGDSNQARTSSAPAVGSSTSVQQATLTTAIERLGSDYIDLLKIDCEGAEWDLFSDCQPWRRVKYLRMEYHLWGLRSYDDVVKALASLGFVITLHRPAGEWGTVWAQNSSLL